jgi:hypothetical protein
MAWIERDGIGFPHPVAVHQVARNQVRRFNTAGVAYGKRRAQYRAADRPPKIHDREAALQPPGGFVRRQVLRNPARRRLERLIIVHPAHGLTQGRAAPLDRAVAHTDVKLAS